MAAELGYSRDLLASSLKRGVTKRVGVVVANLDNPYNARVIRGIARVLEADDFVPLVAETGESRERFERLLDHFGRRRVDALITSAVRLDGAEILARKLGDELPVVLAGRGLPDTDYDTVRHDDVVGGTLAAEHLASLGHRRVAQLAGPDRHRRLHPPRRGVQRGRLGRGDGGDPALGAGQRHSRPSSKGGG